MGGGDYVYWFLIELGFCVWSGGFSFSSDPQVVGFLKKGSVFSGEPLSIELKVRFRVTLPVAYFAKIERGKIKKTRYFTAKCYFTLQIFREKKTTLFQKIVIIQKLLKFPNGNYNGNCNYSL